MAQNFTQTVFTGDRIVHGCPYREEHPKFVIQGWTETGEVCQIPMGESLLSRHMLLLGGIGTGKSNAFNFLINRTLSNLTTNDVVLIFDTKGDYFREFHQPGDIVISNDERASGTNGANYWNIFEELMIDERVEENILEMAKGFFYEKIQSSTQPFFPNAAKDLFSAMLLHLIRTEKNESLRNNASLRQIFDQFSVEVMKKILRSHPDLKAMESYIADERSGQTLGIVAELQQMIREIFIGNFAKRGDLSIRKLIRQKGGKVIFVEYDLGIGSLLTPVYRLLIDLAIKEALCRKENEGNVYFFIDEFRLLPHLSHIDDGINFGRSLGAKFFFGVQNIDQIADAYGKDLAGSILSGFGTMLAFRVNDAGSREFIKQQYGRNMKLNTFMSAVSTRGIVEQLTEGNVIEDVDINDLPVGWCLVRTPGCMPFRFRFPLYKTR